MDFSTGDINKKHRQIIQLKREVTKFEEFMKRIKAIIFDMDGVMFDTERLYTEAFSNVIEKMGFKSEISKEFINSCKGVKKEEIKGRFKSLLDVKSLERYGKEFDFDYCLKQVLSYLDTFIETEGIPVKEGLFDLLKYAKKNGLKIAIGTSEKTERVQNYLVKADLVSDTFDVIITGDMVKNGKPAPDIYLKVCEALLISPDEAIVLEDAPNGIIAAYRAGAKPVMVIDCVQPTDEILEMLFVRPLNSLNDVKKIVFR